MRICKMHYIKGQNAALGGSIHGMSTCCLPVWHPCVPELSSYTTETMQTPSCPWPCRPRHSLSTCVQKIAININALVRLGTHPSLGRPRPSSMHLSPRAHQAHRKSNMQVATHWQGVTAHSTHKMSGTLRQRACVLLIGLGRLWQAGGLTPQPKTGALVDRMSQQKSAPRASFSFITRCGTT